MPGEIQVDLASGTRATVQGKHIRRKGVDGRMCRLELGCRMEVSPRRDRRWVGSILDVEHPWRQGLVLLPFGVEPQTCVSVEHLHQIWLRDQQRLAQTLDGRLRS